SLRSRPPVLLRPTIRRALRQRMVRFRQASVDRLAVLTGRPESEIRGFRREVTSSPLPDTLIQRGAGFPFTQEFPQAGLLYLLVRSHRPKTVIETGVRPGYTTAWILAALEANGEGALHSLGPGPTGHRSQSVRDVTVGQFVPPALRSRWTLVLGNTEANLRTLLAEQRPVDLFLYDNGPDATRARFELHSAWGALSPRGILLAHHVDANHAWSEFCRAQGVAEQILDPGPPRLGAVGMASGLAP
ncbi:MAG: class I SAM-dependent methyltransferase, partial [Thermoplasmata archaeon]|nr:class I SAM-dependent methyltransferase [Thermoplasmata archaeon]